jgi:predicted phosphoribosyltransferase
MLFIDRVDAAKQLANYLKEYKGDKNAIILAIPRGALQLGAILRDELHIPLDIVVTKKIGAPGNDEYAIGVVDPDGSTELNSEVVNSLGIPQSYIDDEARRLRHVIKRRYADYRGDKPLPDLKGKTVIIVDDGVATGFTTMAAVKYAKSLQPKKVVLAVPVAAADSYEKLKKIADEIVCPNVRDDLMAVGQYYASFPQVEDDEARRILNMN